MEKINTSNDMTLKKSLKWNLVMLRITRSDTDAHRATSHTLRPNNSTQQKRYSARNQRSAAS